MTTLEGWADASGWAAEEFGAARLGDARRTKRLVRLAAGAAVRPDGRITAVFPHSADQQGAYDLLANQHVTAEAVAASATRAAVRRAAGHPFAFVPLDGSSVRLTDRRARKGTGPVGKHSTRARGLQLLTALVVTPDGVPQGICDQRFWTRPAPVPKPRGFGRWRAAEQRRWRARRKAARRRRAPAIKESSRWGEALGAVDTAFDTYGDGVQPWPQLDRGGDVDRLLRAAVEGDRLLTVRAGQLERGLADGRTVRATAATAPVLGTHWLEVSAQPGRPARLARLAVRACPAVLRAEGQAGAAALWLVVAEEVSAVAAGQTPLRWVLWTTYPADALDAAALVLDGYACRWRVEDYFRALKRGGCDLERTQLHHPDRVRTWAVVLGSVAMRIARLKHLARTEPDRPADGELTRDELDALILLQRPPGWRVGETPPLGQAVRWLGMMGGHSGRPSAPPAGATVLGRGLERVVFAAEVLRAQREQVAHALAPKK
ncbi:MAG TPA: IS4 family transposase [Polyangiaceae bacterium]|nr:IS4 family transposase [Polyangiaceae bacterium]